MQPRRLRWRSINLGRERRLALLQFIEMRLQTGRTQPVGDRLDDAGQLPVEQPHVPMSGGGRASSLYVRTTLIVMNLKGLIHLSFVTLRRVQLLS